MPGNHTIFDTSASLGAPLADRLPAMIGYWNRGLYCEFANERYRDWFRLAPQAIIGLHMLDLVGEEMYQLNEPYMRRALAGVEQRFERCLAKPDGSSHILDVRYIPDVDAAVGVRGFFVLATGITELRDAYGRIRALFPALNDVAQLSFFRAAQELLKKTSCATPRRAT